MTDSEPQPTPPPLRQAGLRLWLQVALVAACCIVYLPLWKNGFVNFDDDLFIYENPFIRSLDWASIGKLFEIQIGTPYYKPLVYLSWAVEYHLFGLEPRAFHYDNLLLHSLNVLLVFQLLWQIAVRMGLRRRRVVWCVAAATALFALHPLRVESVAWATERKDVLFAFFYLGSLLVYVRYLRHRRCSGLVLSALLFLLGTLCKATVVSLPVVLFLLDALLGRRARGRLLIEKIPHLAVLVAALALYGMLLPLPSEDSATQPSAAPFAPVESPPVGPALERPGEESRPPERGRHLVAASSERVLGLTTRVLWPTDLAVLEPVPAHLRQRATTVRVVGSLAALALAAGLGVAGLRRFPMAAGGGLFYLVTLAPVLAVPVLGTNFLPDRYTYLPSIGLSVVMVRLLAWLARALPSGRKIPVAVGLVYLAGLSLGTYRQVPVWRDSVTLWTTVLERRGEMPIALNNRGVAYKEIGLLEAALADLDRAVAASPRYAKAYNNRALVRHELGDSAAALADMDAAIALTPDEERFYANRGVIAIEAGHVAAAIADYSQAIALAPELVQGYLLRGIARQQLGDFAGAIQDLDRALEMGDVEVDALFHRGVARMRSGDYDGAVADNTAVLALAPEHPGALNNRGFARFYLGQLEAAVEDLDRAIRLQPSYPIAYRNRGDARRALGDLPGSCRDWRVAAALDAPAAAQRLDEFCAEPEDPPAALD